MDLLNLMRESREKLKPHWLIAFFISIIYGVLVGGMSIYLLNIFYDQPASIENLIEGFKPLLKVLLLYLVISIVATIVGFILLIIPGIIIALGLSMSYYILIENPELTIEEI